MSTNPQSQALGRDSLTTMDCINKALFLGSSWRCRIIDAHDARETKTKKTCRNHPFVGGRMILRERNMYSEIEEQELPQKKHKLNNTLGQRNM